MSEVQPEAEVVERITKEAAQGVPITPGDVKLFPTSNSRVIDTESMLAAPRRTRGVYTFEDVTSLAAYVTEHQNADHTTLWIDRDTPSILAVLNDASGTGTGWADHRASCTLIHSPEWLHWSRLDGSWQDQQAFAEHIEDGMLEIKVPSAAEILEVAQSLKGSVNAEWAAAHQLSNGATGFSYTETVAATAATTKGNLEIPSTFELAIAPFYGEQPEELTARLRYKIRNGELALKYQLDRPHDAVLRTLNEIKARLEAKFPRVYLGSPR